MQHALLGAVVAMHALSPSAVPALDVNPSASEILRDMEHLAVVGRVLYVAAHPDDENTRFLAWARATRGLDAVYLSMTRGDGGQNLIGTEQDELLGVLRTDELLAARRIDGARQLFTRARDFGYSKSAKETLAIWGEDEILDDVVRLIRREKPDVIVTRFSTEPPNHGHHTASALLAARAFALAADPTYETPGERPWRAARLLHNVSTWSLPRDADLSHHLALDVGAYDARIGRSIGEIAAASRSQHKSQGFGSAIERGPVVEYFTHLDGARPTTKEPLSGLDFTWSRFAKAERVAAAIDALVASFDPRAPAASAPALARVHRELSALPSENPWRATKLREVERLLAACAGLFVDVRATQERVTPASTLGVTLTALARGDVGARLRAVRFFEEGLASSSALTVDARLAPGASFSRAHALVVSRDAPITTPHWLREPGERGRFVIDDERLIGPPTSRPPLSAVFSVEIAGVFVDVERPVHFTFVDPVDGERTRDVEIAPPVTVTPDRDVVVWPRGRSVSLRVVVRASRDAVAGTLSLALPAGLTATPAAAPFSLARVDDEVTHTFTIAPERGLSLDGAAPLRVVALVDGREHSVREARVAHPHVPRRHVRAPATLRVVPVDLTPSRHAVGYIMGAGDRVAESLSHVGFDVTVLDERMLAEGDLSRFQTIVVGVRALNARPELAAHRERLARFVERGGRLVVQYQTNSRVGPLGVDVFPLPLTIGRARVTDEHAAMRFLDARHPFFTTPHALAPEDLDGWVQERGLYFAESWDTRYAPLIAMHDEGEQDQEGALLVARHGKGLVVYTGLSFFRQLPAGVPGAYRMMANLLGP